MERAAEFRSEFVNGEMFAMAGASVDHVRLQHNLSVELDAALRGSGCEVLGSDMRIMVSNRAYLYADVSVACAPTTPDAHDDNLLNPLVVFEVLSPSTEKYDRGVKFRLYRTIESLKDYLLVSQDEIHVEHFTRQPDGTWSFHEYEGPNAELKIDSLGVTIPLGRIYARVTIPPATN